MDIRTADAVPGQPVSEGGAQGVTFRMLIGPEQDAPTFYMRQFDVAPGGNTPKHAHAWEHEVYILAGQGEVLTPDGYKPVSAGQCVFVPPDSEHQFRNNSDAVLKFLCIVPKP